MTPEIDQHTKDWLARRPRFGSPIPPGLEFALIAERVNDSVETNQLEGERAQIIFAKPIPFFEKALAGEECVRTLILKANSHNDLAIYGLIKNICHSIASERGWDSKDDTRLAIEMINRMKNTCSQLANGQNNDTLKVDLAILNDFFKKLKDVCHAVLATPFDRVRIG